MREIQQKRFEQADVPYVLNAHADGAVLEEIAVLSDEAKALLDQAMAVSKLSARGYFRVLRVARTIADLQEAINGQVYEKIEKIHVAEALGYRRASLS